MQISIIFKAFSRGIYMEKSRKLNLSPIEAYHFCFYFYKACNIMNEYVDLLIEEFIQNKFIHYRSYLCN